MKTKKTNRPAKKTWSIGGIVFIGVQTILLLLVAGCTSNDSAEIVFSKSSKQFNISLMELISVFSFIGGLFGVWIDVRLRIKSLEIKTKQNFDTIKENKTESYSNICEIKQMLKENSTTTNEELKKITEKVNSLHVMFAEKFGTKK